MSQVSKRLPVLLALLVGLAMAFAVWTLPNAVYADDEIPLKDISITADTELDWAQVVFLENAQGKLSADKLGIKVNPTGAQNNCDLSLEAVWWDDKTGADHVESADLNQFGLVGDEAEAGVTEYKLTAAAKEGFGFSGKVSTTFHLVDKTSLSYICSTTDFPGCEKKTGWRMRDWFWFREGQAITPVVKPECGSGKALTEGTDFSVTYYPRSHQDEDMNSPDYGIEYFLNEDVDPLVGPPTQPGGYFAVIEGKGKYHGGNTYPIDIMGASSISFTTDGDDHLWSNQDKVYHVNVPEGVDGELTVEVGFWNPDKKAWGEKFDAKKGYYEFSKDTRTLTLHGDKIIGDYGAPDFPLTLYATVANPGGGEPLASGNEDVWLTSAEYWYDEPRNDDLLPGWESSINDVHIFVRDPDHFDGEEFNQRIKNATIKSQTPAGVLELWNEDGEWRYKALNHGTAVIKATYEDYNGTEKTCEFTVNVSDTVYHVDMRSVNGFRNGLPGSSLTLRADAEKELLVPNYDDPEHPDYDNTTKGLTYKWSIAGGGSFATITQDQNDPAKAVLKFKAMPKGQDWIDEPVRVKVAIWDSESEDPTAERAQTDEEFWVSSEFCQISPALINEDLEVAQTLTYKPEVRVYQYGKKNYSVVKNVEYELHHDDAVEVQENNGTFTIKRVNGWDTWLNVDARWDGGGAWQDYHLNNKDYRIEFGFWDVDLYDDSTVTINPQIRDAVGFSDNDYHIDYKVGTVHWDEHNDTDVWDSYIDAKSDVYTVDGNKIKFDGAAMAKAGLNELRIRADLTVNGENYGSEDCEVRLRVSCPTRGHDHNWIEGVTKQPTLNEVGYRVKICPDYMSLSGCGETRIEEIPKLINISGASVTAIKNQPYTGKALTPSLTVKCNGAALKSGTDYKAKYTNNKKVGTATVTLTGKGKYGGTKKVTFKIVKGTNPMVIKANAVTLKAKDVKKKDQTIKTTAAFTVTKNQGKVTYKKKSGDSKITIAANGTITVKKGLKKGKYKFAVNVTAAGNANYNKITKAATVDITVK